MHEAHDANDDIPLVRYTLGISATAIVEAVQCRGRLLARKSMRFTRRMPLETMISEIGLIQKLRHCHIVQVIGSYTQRRNFSVFSQYAASVRASFQSMIAKLSSCARVSAPLQYLRMN